LLNTLQRHPSPLPAQRTAASQLDQSTRRPAPARDLLVSFDTDEPKLCGPSAGVVEHWAQRWQRREPDALLVMADSGPNLAGRVRRLRQLRDMLTRCGIAIQRIRYTDDRLGRASPPDGSLPHPRCRAWVKVISAEDAERIVLPIHAYFRSQRLPPRTVCITAA
jgi:hypothetical protein